VAEPEQRKEPEPLEQRKEEEGGVYHHRFQIAYFGDDPSDHSMDVMELGPALYGFGMAISAANTRLNGQKSKVRVLVESDFEHKCFSINFEIIQEVWKVLKNFLDKDRFEGVNEMLTYLGMVGGVGVGSVLGYLKMETRSQG
jgi:hypothetical protein